MKNTCVHTQQNLEQNTTHTRVIQRYAFIDSRDFPLVVISSRGNIKYRRAVALVTLKSEILTSQVFHVHLAFAVSPTAHPRASAPYLQK